MASYYESVGVVALEYRNARQNYLAVCKANKALAGGVGATAHSTANPAVKTAFKAQYKAQCNLIKAALQD